jgi:hypothetical protein
MMERDQRAVLWSQKDRRNTNQPLFSNEFQMNGASGEYPRTGPAIVAMDNNEEDEMLMGSRKKEDSMNKGSGGISDEEAPPMFNQGVNH